MTIISQEALTDNFIKDVLVKMLNDDPNLEIYETSRAIEVLKEDGQSLEDYVEMNPQEAGQAFAAVLFDYLGGDSLRKIVLGE